MTPGIGTHRYELRPVALLVRYLPVFVGVILSTAFSLSVRYDDADIAKAAWVTGSELLGLYGGVGAIVLPFLLAVTAIWRRGRASRIASLEVSSAGISIALLDGRRLHLPAERIRSAFALPMRDRRRVVSLELTGGLTEGDRVVLELDEPWAAEVERRFAGRAARIDLTTRGPVVGGLVTTAASMVGTVTALTTYQALLHSIAQRPYDPAFVGGSLGWTVGLIVAHVGFFHALFSLLSSPPSVVVGVDGVRIEGFFVRFVSYSEILRITYGLRGFTIELTSGRRVHVRALGMGMERASALVRAIEARLSSVTGSLSLPRLHGPNSVRRWREAVLRRASTSGYRKADSSQESLAQSLTEPGLDGDARLAAAVALAARDDGDARGCIRIAARAVADEPTRALLERMAEGEADDAAIEAGLVHCARRGT